MLFPDNIGSSFADAALQAGRYCLPQHVGGETPHLFGQRLVAAACMLGGSVLVVLNVAMMASQASQASQAGPASSGNAARYGQ